MKDELFLDLAIYGMEQPAGKNIHRMIEEKLRELGGRAPLLKEVGSFKGSGADEMVFDLGGNVAEWVVAKDGSGRAMGGSADTPADAKLRARKPAPEYTGFRVVKGAAATVPASR